MAIEYELHLSDPRPAEELLAAAGIGEVRGLSLTPGRPQASRAHVIREAYGFTSRTDLLLRLDLSAYDADDGYAGNFALVRVVMALLKAAQGDAVLLFNWEQPLLLRRDGRVTLNRDGAWCQSPSLRGLVDVPCFEDSLPSL